MSGLKRTLDCQLSDLPDEPVALVPIGELPAERGDSTSYDNVDSRFVVKVVCKSLRTRHPKVLDGWGIETLRAGRVRHLIFVDDLVGSGRSLTKSIQTWLKNKTIRSWYSSGYIDIQAIAFAATSTGLNRANKSRIRLTVSDSACDLQAAARRWPEINYGDARQLLSTYGKGRAKRGWGNAEALIVLQHTIPNSLPAIFTQTISRDESTWPWLFNRETYDFNGDLAEARPYAPVRRIKDVLYQHLPYLRPEWVERQSLPTLETLLAARLSVHQEEPNESIARIMDLPLDQVVARLTTAAAIGLDDHAQLAKELRVASSRNTHLRRPAFPRSTEYYPQFIRPRG